MSQPNNNKSLGHIGYVGDREVFEQDGQVFFAPSSNPIDVYGYRQGARWESSMGHWERNGSKIYDLSSQPQCDLDDTANLDQFITGYIEALLFCEAPEDSVGCESELSEAALQEITEDCTGFYNHNVSLLDGRYARAGHDFALTRNGHGAGFWDGDWPQHGEELTEAAKVYGTQGLYFGDDELLHTHG